MSPLRVRMLEDMSLAGLAKGTQKLYVSAVYRLTAHYRRIRPAGAALLG